MVLTNDQRRKLDVIMPAFQNSEMEELDCTTLIEHSIDTGNYRPVKQRYYPISPAAENLVCQELDSVRQSGVLEEAPSSM